MKKRIALLLAVVMTLSMLPLMNVTAAPTAYSISSVASVAGGTLLFEPTIYSASSQVIKKAGESVGSMELLW